jgi:hypothetical protein
MKSIKKSFLRLPVFLFFILFIFNSPDIFPQDFMLSSYWDFYSNNYLSSQSSARGFSGIAAENDLIGTVLNPATLTVNKKWSFSGEYIYKSNVSWPRPNGFPDFDLRQYHPTLSAGVGYKISNCFAAGIMYDYGNSYMNVLDFVRTNEFGEPIGTYEVYDKTSISNISMPIVFNYKNVLKVGVSLNYSFFHRVMGPLGNVGNELAEDEVKANFQKFYPQAGIVVSPIKQWSIGFVFKPEIRGKLVWEFPDGTTNINGDDNIIPLHIGAGTKVCLSKIKLNLYADYNFYQTSVEDIMKDRHNFNVGAEYNYDKNLLLKLGFFTMLDNRNFDINPSWTDAKGKYTQYFVTLGASYTHKKLTYSFAMMDSHLFSTGLIKQTLLNAGVRLDL